MSKCKVCRQHFEKRSSWQKVCAKVECATEWVKLERERAGIRERKEQRSKDKARLMEMKPRGWWFKKTSAALRLLTRERDEGKECISCPTILIKRGRVGGDYDAGHYRGVGRAAHLELVEINVNGQCKHCNDHGKGMYLAQRPKMIERHGEDAVLALEADNAPRKYTIPELQEMETNFKRRTKETRDAKQNRPDD